MGTLREWKKGKAVQSLDQSEDDDQANKKRSIWDKMWGAHSVGDGKHLQPDKPNGPKIDAQDSQTNDMSIEHALNAMAESLDDLDGFSAMEWDDFTRLVCDVIQKEFTQGGGEVEVRQPNQDGSVDAIAVDPDPILGGKFVIQAKKYSDIIGVSTLRDLFETVVNEGASKGILITTEDYGRDAYEFARGKPLTLLSGNDLRYLIEAHGIKRKKP